MADNKIEEIRARHALSASWSNGYSDRATLLAEIDRQRAEIERLTRERDEARAEVERLRAEIDGLEAELSLMKSGFEVAYRAMGDKP